MDPTTANLVVEADHLVKRAAWLAERNLPPDTHAAGRCTKCGGWIFALTAREWSQAVKEPCPHCGVKGW